MEELYKKHRPKDFSDLIGQDDNVKILEEAIKKKRLPHTLMFTGISGSGKTTTARIIKEKMGCADIDYKEMNCADDRGIEMARDVSQNIHTSAMGGSCRIWVLDEFHQATTGAQQALLKALEDTPKHSYLILLTSEAEKVIKAIQTRSTIIRLNSLTESEIERLIKRIAKKEKMQLDAKVVKRIAEFSEGSARRALVHLNKIRDIKETKSQLDAIQRSDVQKTGIELARLLFGQNKADWKAVRELLKGLKDQPPEEIRRIVLGYGSSSLVNGWGNTKKSAYVMNCFIDPFYDTLYPGLVLACYEAVHGL